MDDEQDFRDLMRQVQAGSEEAARRLCDDYGSHNTPQFGVEWRPAETLLIRAAYADAYRAPSLFQLHRPQRTFPPIVLITDPLLGGIAYRTAVTIGGNPNLKVETGHSRSVGLVWSPKAMEGFQSSLTTWSIDQANRVASGIGTQTVIDNAALFPGRVTRGPSQSGQPGRVQLVDISAVNFGSLKVSGSDLSLRYSYATSHGTLTPSVSVTEMYSYLAAVTPGVPETQRLSKANDDAWAPRWKGIAAWMHPQRTAE